MTQRSYQLEPDLGCEEFIDVLRRSTLAAPAAQTYYPHIGMQQHPSCWTTQGKTQ